MEDCLLRIQKMNPGFFDAAFPLNLVPARFKISHRLGLGSSSGSAQQKTMVRDVIATHLARLPPDARFLFTDGFARPDSGPAGAGALVFSAGDHSRPLYSCAAAIGHSTKIIGDLVAIGIGIESCAQEGFRGDLHIYTNTKLTYNALVHNHKMRADTAPCIYQLRTLIRNYRLATRAVVKCHWVPGHAGNPLTDAAVQLAKAAAKVSRSHFTDFDVLNAISTSSFLSLLSSTRAVAPWLANSPPPSFSFTTTDSLNISPLGRS